MYNPVIVGGHGEIDIVEHSLQFTNTLVKAGIRVDETVAWAAWPHCNPPPGGCYDSSHMTYNWLIEHRDSGARVWAWLTRLPDGTTRFEVTTERHWDDGWIGGDIPDACMAASWSYGAGWYDVYVPLACFHHPEPFVPVDPATVTELESLVITSLWPPHADEPVWDVAPDQQVPLRYAGPVGVSESLD